MPSVSEHAMLHALTEEVVDAVVDGFGPGSGSPLMMVEFRHAGGALARPGSGALACLPGDYVMFACKPRPPLAEANAAAFARLRETVASCAPTALRELRGAHPRSRDPLRRGVGDAPARRPDRIRPGRPLRRRPTF